MTVRWLVRLVALLALAVAVSTILSWAALSKVSGQADRNTALAQRVAEQTDRIAQQTAQIQSLVAQMQDDRKARDRETQRTTQALCALRKDLDRRVQSSKDYLRENPRGAPGISVKVIRDGIANQQRTIDALRILKC